ESCLVVTAEQGVHQCMPQQLCRHKCLPSAELPAQPLCVVSVDLLHVQNDRMHQIVVAVLLQSAGLCPDRTKRSQSAHSLFGCLPQCLRPPSHRPLLLVPHGRI